MKPSLYIFIYIPGSLDLTGSLGSGPRDPYRRLCKNIIRAEFGIELEVLRPALYEFAPHDRHTTATRLLNSYKGFTGSIRSHVFSLAFTPTPSLLPLRLHRCGKLA